MLSMSAAANSFDDAEEIDPVNLPSDAHAEAVVLMKQAADQGWRLSHRDPKRGWRIWCPCRESGKTHQAWIEPSPTSESYFDQTRQRLSRMTCWEERP